MSLAQPTNRNDTDGHPLVTRRQRFSEDWMRRIAAMLGHHGLAWSGGDPVPFGWHFPLLGAETPRALLRADGFPGLGLPFPDIASKRLVATGRVVETEGRICLDQVLERTSRVAEIKQKSGAHGAMTFVTIEHVFHDFPGRAPLLAEKQTFLVLDAPYAPTPPAQTSAAHSIVKTITPNDTLLFQFSSLSFNTHKIHLDRDYARTVEGYPDLVVNGGLTTLFMTEIARAAFGETIKRLSVRNSAPLFCNRPIHFAQANQDGRQSILALDDYGRVAAEMEFEIGDV
jgi:3-methylfumaryl-CoA hydratase